MKKINFNLEKYRLGNFNVTSRSGQSVEIAAIDESKNESAIIGWIGSLACSWTIDGKYLEGETDGRDLFLKEKSRTVYINVLRSDSGDIRVYGTVDIKPRVYKGSEVIKSLEIEI